MENYYLPKNYRIRNKTIHFDDTKYKDKFQKEVYLYAQKIMQDNSFNKIIDIGCGSGYKLIKYLGQYETIGYETEPAISYLRNTYPNRKWIESGKPDETFEGDITECDLIICSDVIEHIRDPTELINFMKKFKTKYYLISTPAREIIYKDKPNKMFGPPRNRAHVREWTFDEFKLYLNEYFDIIDSQMGITQLECQWHLCIEKK